MIPGTSLTEKLLGSKQIMFKGSGAHVIPAGWQCWGVLIRADNTKITTITQNVEGTATVYISGDDFIDSWLNVASLLLQNDFLIMDTPITSLTLNAAGDAVCCYCEPFLGYVEPES